MSILNNIVPNKLRNENPDFSKLLSLIEKKISSNGASLNIIQQNKEAKVEMKNEKKKYLMTDINYNEINTAILESKNTNSSQSNRNFYEQVENNICLAELKNSLNISNCKQSKLGLSEADLLNFDPNKQTLAQMNQRLLSDIENRIHMKTLEIIKLNNSNSDSVSNSLYKINLQLKQEVKSIADIKNRIQSLDNQIESIFRKLSQMSSVFDKSVEELILKLNFDEKIEQDHLEFNEIDIKIETLGKKLRKTELKLICDYNTPENIKAQKTIRDRLKCEQNILDREITNNEEKLSEYSKLLNSELFKKLIDEYQNICERIETTRQCIKEYKRVDCQRNRLDEVIDKNSFSEDGSTSKESSQW